MLTATSSHAAKIPARLTSSRGREKCAFVARKASPSGCSQFGLNLGRRRIAYAHHRRLCREPKPLRQSNRAVPTENNSGAQKSLVAARASGQKNRSRQPSRSFGRKWRRVSRPRDVSDDGRAQPIRTFVPI